MLLVLIMTLVRERMYKSNLAKWGLSRKFTTIDFAAAAKCIKDVGGKIHERRFLLRGGGEIMIADVQQYLRRQGTTEEEVLAAVDPSSPRMDDFQLEMTT